MKVLVYNEYTNKMETYNRSLGSPMPYIKNKYLTDIYCMRVNIGYDISKVARRMGDFATGELDKTMNTEILNGAIAEAYQKYAKGQTLIFATSVEHAQNIAKLISRSSSSNSRY